MLVLLLTVVVTFTSEEQCSVTTQPLQLPYVQGQDVSVEVKYDFDTFEIIRRSITWFVSFLFNKNHDSKTKQSHTELQEAEAIMAAKKKRMSSLVNTIVTDPENWLHDVHDFISFLNNGSIKSVYKTPRKTTIAAFKRYLQLQ